MSDINWDGLIEWLSYAQSNTGAKRDKDKIADIQEALKRGKELDGKFDVLQHLRAMPDLKDKYGNVWTQYREGHFHYVVKGSNNTDFLTVGELLTHFDRVHLLTYMEEAL